MGVALVAWAYFFIWCVLQGRKPGIAAEEPTLALYGPTFKLVRGLAFLVFAVGGFFIPLRTDPVAFVLEQIEPMGFALGGLVLIGGLMTAATASYIRWRVGQSGVIIEPLSFVQILGRVFAGFAVLGLAIVVPSVAAAAMGTSVEDLSDQADAGFFASALTLLVLFWLIPAIGAQSFEERDFARVWIVSPALVLFRWVLLGFIVLAATGPLSGIIGLDAVFIHPLPVASGVVIPLAGAVLYGFVWGLPMRVIARHAADGNYVAQEYVARVRFSGFLAWWDFRSRARSGAKRYASEEVDKLCPTCLRSIGDISLYASLKFDACPHCDSFIPPFFSTKDYLDFQAERLVPLIEESEQERASGVRRKRKPGDDDSRRVQDLLRSLIGAAVSDRGTDLHLLVEEDAFVIRCRTDGMLYTLIEFNKIMARPVISALKVIANMDITERRKPQDGSFKIEIQDQTIDVRVNTSPLAEGEMAVTRLLYRRGVTGSIEKLGMGPRTARRLLDIIRRPSGLILVTGPTGSGKSTTLYNSLETIATGDRNIITLEDPIEYQLKGISQMQVNEAKGFTFATGLRSILRQDPDVILIGEIRDSDTAKMAIDAAATGHLVFSTLHAMDSVKAVGRLSDLGVDAERYSTVVLLVLAQRLVRLNCTECLESYTLSSAELAGMDINSCPREEFDTRRGVGCPRCRESGFYGREGIYEFFIPSDEVRGMIARSAPVAAIRQRARTAGMRTLLEDGLTKVLMGRTTLAEVLRVAD